MNDAPLESSFDLAIPVILRHEGGWVDDPDDHGGETNFGISMLMVRHEGMLAADLGLPNFAPGCMKLLTVECARDLYRRFFWNRYGFGRLSNQVVATKVFDAAVNCGAYRASVLAQRAGGVPDDGALGPVSIAAINAMRSTEFLGRFVEQLQHFYRGIVQEHPTQVKFLSNWLRRAADIPVFPLIGAST